MHLHKSQPSFSETAAEIDRFKQHVTALPCPSCTQKTLTVNKLEVGPKGWTSDISCRNCDFKGSVANSGFSFLGVSSQGKAVKTEKKK